MKILTMKSNSLMKQQKLLGFFFLEKQNDLNILKKKKTKISWAKQYMLTQGMVFNSMRKCRWKKTIFLNNFMLEGAMMASFVQGLWKVMQMERKQVNGLIF